MNFHVPNFNMKNLVKEAGSTFSRVVQVFTYIQTNTHTHIHI